MGKGTGRSVGRPPKYNAKTWVPQGYSRRGKPTEEDRLILLAAKEDMLSKRDGPRSLVDLLRKQGSKGKDSAKHQSLTVSKAKDDGSGQERPSRVGM